VQESKNLYAEERRAKNAENSRVAKWPMAPRDHFAVKRRINLPRN